MCLGVRGIWVFGFEGFVFSVFGFWGIGFRV